MLKRIFLATALFCSSAHAETDPVKAAQAVFNQQVQNTLYWLKEVKRACPAADFKRFVKYLRTDPRGIHFTPNFDETCARAKTYLFINTRDADLRVREAYMAAELGNQAEKASAFRDFFLCGGQYVSLC